MGRSVSVSGPQFGVQSCHELGSRTLPLRGGRVATQDIDNYRRRVAADHVQLNSGGLRIPIGVDLSDECEVCLSPQNVANLGGLRDGMQVRRRCGITGGLCGETGDVVWCFHRGPVSIQGGDTLTLRACGTVDELPCRGNCGLRAGIVRDGILEARQNALRGFCDEAGDRA